MPSKTSSRPRSQKISSNRPKLMRSSATAPALATSNASRQDLANIHNPRALLTTLASYSTPHDYDHGRMTSNGSLSSNTDQSPTGSLAERRAAFESLQAQSNYFSFPSFEDFQEYQDDRQRREARQARQANGVH